MRYLKTSVVMTLGLLLVLTLRLHGQAPQRDFLVWAPVPSTPNGWVAPNKPHTKLADLLAAQIIGAGDPEIRKGVVAYKAKMAKDIQAKDDELQEKGVQKYLAEKGLL